MAYVLLVQVFSSMVAYWAAKFAAKVTTCPQSSSEIVYREMLLPPLMFRCVSRAWASPCP